MSTHTAAAPVLTRLALAFAVLAGTPILLAGGCGSNKGTASGGSTTTTTTTTTTSTSTTSATCIACFGTPDCPAPPDCQHPACVDGCCTTTNLVAGFGCASNGGSFCDGKGNCLGCVDITDCPVTSSVCAAPLCANGTCTVLHAPPGMSCAENGGHACDGHGSCVDCATAGNCPTTGTTCATPTCSSANLCGVSFAARGTGCADQGGSTCDGSGHCTLSTCINGSKDGTETDVDCGGACPPCADGKGCGTGADCVDKVCGTAAPTVCLAPTCSDGVQNGTETDIDCGGPCGPCADTKHCVANADCVNGQCFGYGPGTCVSCTDGVKDGSETGVDCGGSACDLMGKRCVLDGGCGNGADCTSGYCPSGNCSLKPDGTACNASSECTNAHCLLDICCHTTCPASAPSTCGNDGNCLANGAGCEQYQAGASCGAAACSGEMLTLGACDGNGSCGAGMPTACPGHFACQSATACATTCTSDAGCATGYHCQANGTCH